MPTQANVEQFREMGALPISICFGSDITAADFETHSASRHKSCRLKYNNSKLARAKKRIISQVQDSERPNPSECRPPITIPPPSGAKEHSLPHSYAFIPAVALTTTQVSVPKLDSIEPTTTCLDEAMEEDSSPTPTCLDVAIAEETNWVKHGLTLVEKEELTQQDAIAWAAYHALQQPPMEDPPAMCALLPLFYEKAATPAMIKRGMDVQKQAVEYLNPGQIPVTTFDQPLFALAKYVQWKWPATHGGAVHVVMLGGLHTEMALGDIVEGSGWTTALIEAEVARSFHEI